MAEWDSQHLSSEQQCGEICVFSPSPLYTVTIEAGPDDQADVHFHAGGQGVWVARMAVCLGSPVTLCAPFGGESGILLRTLIEAEQVSVRPVNSQGWNGGYIHDRRGGERHVIAEVQSPQLTRHEVDNLYNATISAGLSARCVVLTGPAHESVLLADVYRRLAHDLGTNGILVVADLSRSALKALDGGVYILKVSHEELIDAGYCHRNEPTQLRAGLDQLQQTSGARHIVVSRAEAPTLALIDDRLVNVTTPRLEPMDPRGAGDSMTAGLAVGSAAGMALDDTLRLAAAAGALNVTRHGLGSGQRDHIEQLAKRIDVQPAVG
jgi:1-phosphofructokinase